MIDDEGGIAALDEWLDANVDALYKEQPLGQDWARIAKIGEEYGEAVQAFIGCTGQNPRKGYTHTTADVTDELVDTLITCVLAIQHFTKDAARTVKIIDARWDYRKSKAVLPGTASCDKRQG